MPIGPPSYLPEPKSACMPSPGPIARTTKSEFDALGSLSTRWFQGLFFGKIAQPPTFGSAPPPAASAAVALTAAMDRSRTRGRRRTTQEATDYRRGPSRRWTTWHMRLPALLIAAVLLLPATAAASPYLPPPGKTFGGLTGGYEASEYAGATHSHPSVFQFFGGWNQTTRYMFSGAREANARLMIHLSTLRGTTEQVTPRAIARGKGDTYLRKLNARIAAYGAVTYIRLMSEMDGHWNAYCAYTASGRPKGPAYSTAMFRQAWRRTVLVIRGGPIGELNARLRALHMPPVDTGGRDLARPPVAFLWVPQVEGAPDIRANSSRAYWPGARYVDWVGTDFYSRFPNWSGLERFYSTRAWARKPFAFAEWALWGGDDPSFVNRLFGWSRSHRRVRMLLYNQGQRTNGPFRLSRYPRARRALASELRAYRFAIPPEG